MLNSLLDRLLPAICLLCDQVTPAPVDLCAHCAAELPWNLTCCPRCAEPWSIGQTTCPQCLARPPPFERSEAPLLYAGFARSWVQAVKRGRGLTEARLLGMLLAQHLTRAYAADELPDCIVAVPLHWRRLARRGHNQALLIAAPVARVLQLPLLRTGISRHSARSQQALSRSQRAANVRGVFHTRRQWAGKRVAVVDDVMTTGATASALAQTLLDAGASAVHVWCATRTSST